MKPPLKTMETNQKTWKTMKPPLKTLETNQKPWKTMKPPLKTMETNQKPWKTKKWWFFGQTDTHHNIYITIISSRIKRVSPSRADRQVDVAQDGVQTACQRDNSIVGKVKISCAILFKVWNGIVTRCIALCFIVITQLSGKSNFS